jgi:hypothetical protein
MSDLAGLLVLSIGPLALLALLLVGILVVWIAVRTQATPPRKWAAAIAAGVTVTLIPTWDVIAGRLYFRYLCAADAGVRIYKSVELRPEDYAVQFPANPAVYRRLQISERYPYRLDSVEDLPGPAKIKMIRQSVIDAKTGDVLGDITEYSYGGGWFENAISFHGAGGGHCASDGNNFKMFLERIFRRR